MAKAKTQICSAYQTETIEKRRLHQLKQDIKQLGAHSFKMKHIANYLHNTFSLH